MKRKIAVDPLILARALILLEVCLLTVSTAAAVVVEVILFVTFLGVGTLRRQVFASLKQPVVLMALVLYAMVGLGIVYSVAPVSEGMDMWGSWRKFLLVPLVVAVYGNIEWKERFVFVFIGLMLVATMVSFISYTMGIAIYKYDVGIVISNYATQGMFFVTAIYACLVLLRFPSGHTIRHRGFLAVTAVILTLNVLFVTPGRSGYLAFLVSTMVFVFFAIPGKKRFFLMLMVPLAVACVLMLSPIANERIRQGVAEIQTYEHDQEITSMGLRVVWWKNTFAILKKAEHPILGYGTSGFETVYAAHVAGQKGWQGEPTTDPHNQFLRILFEHGIIGLILFLTFIASFFRQPVNGCFYYLGTGILLAWCATSLFSGHFTTFQEGRFLLIWCSVMLAAYPNTESLNP